jgi:asparagine synthase (glutamine-hydrolysing)
MPGIVGLITKLPRAWAEPQLQRMVESIRHESFYEIGTWIDESLGVYAGWAARQGSPAASMPVCCGTGEVSLVFSGEDFPDPAVVNGSQPPDAKPLSYLLRMYEEDASFPARLNGRFQGLLTDAKQGTAILFNDRFGMHRIYYHEAKEAFYFAAEAKAILAVRRELRATSLKSLGEFLACGCVLEDRSLFEGINVLPTASAWVFRQGSLEHKRSYFHPREWEEQAPLEPEAYYQELKTVFAQNLPRYFNGRERIGMSLTGGLDTRMIMAWRKFPSRSLPCYSFGSMFRDCQDVSLARQVAEVCGQSHEVIEVGDDFLSRFPHYAERAVYLSDGCTEVSRASDLYVNEKAREIAPVRMTGNYGGEVLRRIVAFRPGLPTPGLFHAELVESARQTADTYRGLLQCHPLSFAVFRQAPWHHYGLLELEQTQIALRSPYLDNDFVRTVFRAPESALDTEFCLRLIADGDQTLRRMRTDRGLGGNRGRVHSAISRGLLEFTFKAEYAYDYGMPQSVVQVDHAFASLHLERLFLGRHKFGHYRLWYRDALARYVREILLDSRSLSRAYLDKKTVEHIVRSHTTSKRNYTTTIHKLLTLEHVHRLFIDAN